ncbi:hypothetical protein JIG36_34815 [Actinoplanes sp. LDG1-06]|uniref:Glycosyltransferase RgtA/B/C/D-like domain-containing protein n=1 Tax=Paractinoplanes ovalisporus TaxID=2810368 RepID=A0ABS2ALL7_9ACTN|nr:hypothetical protein [Actinoplanes ovalisporus]MBM2620686.1 hypothetical protein [Actinoplanes ovalisporus]
MTLAGAIATSMVPARHRSRAAQWLPYLPAAVVLAVQAVLTLRLDNIANVDEALYINAGHAYIAEWSGGPKAPDYGGFFSGFPLAYPVFGAVIDHFGGLEAARVASLLLTFVAVACCGSIAAWLAGPDRATVARPVAMAFAALAGPTLFVGNLATFDAPCAVAVIGSAALAMTRRSYATAVLAGVIAGAGAVVKYTGAPFILVTAGLALLCEPTVRRGIARALVVLTTAVASVLAVYLPNASWINGGIAFTTTNREAHNYRDLTFLLGEYLLGMGLLTALALAGLILLVRRTRTVRHALIGCAMIGAGLAVSVSQGRLHEYTSFNKHLIFTALFLAPLAAQAAVLPRVRLVRPAVIVLSLYLLTVGALYRSDFMYHEWPDFSPVVERIHQIDQPGIYMGIGGHAMAYYSKDYPEMEWVEPFTLYGSGPGQMREEVAEARYAGIVLTTGATGSDALDRNTALMLDLLGKSPDYELAGRWPKHRYDTNEFYLYMRRS